jgi:signal transduction histidine kinase
MEFWIVRPDGTRRRVRNRYVTGDHSRYVVTSDITEQWQVEEYLRQTQKMEAMGRMAAGVAHDFNNYLTAMGGYVELLLMNIQEGHPHYDDMAGIQKAVRQSRTLVQQLMTFSRHQQHQVHPQLLDLNHEIGKAESILQRLAGRDIELVTECDPDLGMVRADAGQIEQVLLNLVTNARDAISGPGMITIRTESLNGRAVLSVGDTGGGIDEDALEHIFEPFFTTKEQGKGTGLGLATVYSIVQQSGGWIEAANREGTGAVFSIFFPSLEAV